jgi:aminoglycoside phosphotransferase (APT) family kinase protein
VDDDELARIARWLGEPVVVDGAATTGASNVTWFVTVGGRAAVLRHPPRRPDRLPTAHDLVREATVLRSLAGRGLPVPEVLALDAGSTVLDVPLLVTARLPGVCLLGARPAHLDPAALAAGAVDVLAAVHAVGPGSSGLDAPEGSYLVRQIERWRTQLDRTPTAGRLGPLDDLVDWLLAHRPAGEERTLVHGDYGFHNLLVSARRVEAVLDWELATLGDPVADLFGLVKSWGPDPVTPNPANDVVALAPGAPARDALIARYEACTGREVRPHVRFYDVFGCWRSIGIFEGIHARSGATRFVDDTPRLVARARAMMAV